MTNLNYFNTEMSRVISIKMGRAGTIIQQDSVMRLAVHKRHEEARRFNTGKERSEPNYTR